MHQKLIPDHYLVLVTAINKSMHLRNSFGNRQFEKKSPNSSKNLTLLFSNPTLLTEIVMKLKRCM